MAGFVQALSATYSGIPLTIHPIVLTADTTLNNSVHVAFRTSAASVTISSVTDTKGNTYSWKSGTRAGARGHLISTSQDGGRLVTNDIITITVSASSSAQGLVGEYTPIPASFTDQDTSTNGAAATSATVGATAATTQADDFVISVMAWAAGVSAITVTGYTSRIGGGLGLGLADKVVSATGTQSAAWAWTTSSAWDGVIRAFKQLVFTGTSAQTLPALTQAATGRVSAVGTAAQTLPALTQSAAGVTSPPVFTGTSAQTLPALTQSAVGTSSPPVFTGTSAQVLPSLTQAAAGTVTQPSFTGTSAQILPALTQSAVGRVSSVGTVAQTLPALTQSAAGTTTPPSFTGTAVQTLPSLSQSAVGTAGPPLFAGTAAQTLPALTQSAAGVFTPPATITGTAAQTLPALTQDAEGYVTGLVTTPASRTVVVEAENRTVVVEAENRVLEVV